MNMGMDRLKWNFSSLEQLHQTVNSTLHFAMKNERCKRWSKVIESYKLLLWVINLKNLPDDYEPPSSYPMLLYEIYYHIGVGLQHQGNHKKAITEFSSAMDVVSMPKNGCMAGCVTNSCLMTPIYARRAFAHARAGDMKNALKDAEKAVVLDSKNPAVYCVRALVKNTKDDLKGAMKDIDLALKLDSSHTCSLVLRAAFAKPMLNEDAATEETEAEVDAQESQPSSENIDSCFNVTNFRHPYCMEFYDKFLFTLCVPHTILNIDLTPEKPSKKQLDSNPEMYKSKSHQRPESTSEKQTEPFRCGTPVSQDSGMTNRRRLDYGEAIRKYMSRPKTASAFFAQLEKERRKKADIEEMNRRRAVTAGVRRLLATPSSSRTITADSKRNDSSQKSNPELREGTSCSKYSSTTIRLMADHSVSQSNLSTTFKSAKESETESEIRKKSNSPTKLTTTSGADSRISQRSQKLTIPTPVSYSIPVFQGVNIQDAPRMYYKPWKGDKLPAEDIQRHTHAPAWR